MCGQSEINPHLSGTGGLFFCVFLRGFEGVVF